MECSSPPLDPCADLPGDVFVHALLLSQFDMSTLAWVFVRVSRSWRDAILRRLYYRWKAPDSYQPFRWTKEPEEEVSGLVPPMDPLLMEWGRQGWLDLLQWAHGLGFSMLHWDDHPYGGRHTLLEAACGGGHQPVVTWILDDLGGYLDQKKAIKGACRSGNDALLRCLVEERHAVPHFYIPSDENPASWGNLETCQWLAQHCRSYRWLTAAGRNDHRHILEWAISEGRAVEYLVWPQGCCVWLTVPAHTPGRRCGSGRAA